MGDDKAALLAALRAALGQVQGANIVLGQPISHRIDHLLSGSRANVAVKIFGPDLYELRRLAEMVSGTRAGAARRCRREDVQGPLR
jgi:Cu/Ag efflux pump CusA